MSRTTHSSSYFSFQKRHRNKRINIRMLSIFKDWQHISSEERERDRQTERRKKTEEDSLRKYCKGSYSRLVFYCNAYIIVEYSSRRKRKKSCSSSSSLLLDQRTRGLIFCLAFPNEWFYLCCAHENFRSRSDTSIG